MNWKDELRKAPFDLGRAQEEGRRIKRANKQQLVEKLNSLLKANFDKPLKEAIRANPDARVYTINMPSKFFDNLARLQKMGLSKTEIDESMTNLYNADRVFVNATRGIVELNPKKNS